MFPWRWLDSAACQRTRCPEPIVAPLARSAVLATLWMELAGGGARHARRGRCPTSAAARRCGIPRRRTTRGTCAPRSGARSWNSAAWRRKKGRPWATASRAAAAAERKSRRAKPHRTTTGSSTRTETAKGISIRRAEGNHSGTARTDLMRRAPTAEEAETWETWLSTDVPPQSPSMNFVVAACACDDIARSRHALLLNTPAR